MTSNTFKDTASGSFEDTTVKTKVTIDSGALGQTGSDSYITAKETVNYPNTPLVNVIANKAKDISAYSGDSQIKNLSSGKTATIELTYTTAELAVSGVDTPAEVALLSVSTVNDQKEWESLNTSATYYDSSGNAVAAGDVLLNLSNVTQVVFSTTEATHFSPYALTVATDPTAPATPSGLAVSTPSSATALTLTWTANSESDLSGYYVYRDTSSGGSFPLLATVGAVTTYTNTGLSAATTYYYKIGAYDTNSFESTSTEAVSARTLSADSGGIIGSDGGGSVPTPVYTVIPGTSSSVASTASSASQGTTVAQTTTKTISTPSGITITITKTLKLGSENSEVKALQQALAQDKDIYPEGKVTGYYGALTRNAIKRFQKKYGIEPVGYVGPQTRKKLNEIYGQTQTSSASSAATSSVSSTSGTTKAQQVQAIQTLINQLLEQVKAMQAKKTQ